MSPAFLENLPPFLPIGPRTDKSVGPGKTSACDVAGCGRTTMYEFIGKGSVRAVKMGRKRLVDTASLLNLLGSLPEA